MKIDEILRIAQKKLVEEPFDIAHDIHHHLNVWRNCQFIYSQERLQLDMEMLRIAAWWHDFERGSKRHGILRDEMAKLSFDADYIESVIELINSHSFDDEHSKQTEAMVLYDADKIEYVSPDRFCWMGEGTLNGQMELEVCRLYAKAMIDRLATVIDTLSFDTSRHLFLQNMQIYLIVSEANKDRYKDFLRDEDRLYFISQYERLKSMI